MAIKTPHIALTLRGDSVNKGIFISKGQVPFNPTWGLTRSNSGLLAAVSFLEEGSVEKVYIALTEHRVVLVPCKEDNLQPRTRRELVLVQQYITGSGGKRWPSFHVEFGPEVRQLSSVSTSGGSGGETWMLVSAPLGWAQNIAAQFINKRDHEDQVISYKQDFNPREQELERQLVELRGRLNYVDHELEAVKRGEKDYIVLSFTQGRHPKTGEVQWENTAWQNGKTVKFVVNIYGQQPGSAKEQWVCRKRQILVDIPNFQVVLIDLMFRLDERDAILAKVQEIETELMQIRNSV